jgi:hypothetical protein
MFGISRFGLSTFSLSRFRLSRFGLSRFGHGFPVKYKTKLHNIQKGLVLEIIFFHRWLNFEVLRCLGSFLTGAFDIWFRRIHIIHNHRYFPQLVQEDPHHPQPQVFPTIGSGGSTLSTTTGIPYNWFRTIHIIYNYRYFPQLVCRINMIHTHVEDT